MERVNEKDSNPHSGDRLFCCLTRDTAIIAAQLNQAVPATDIDSRFDHLDVITVANGPEVEFRTSSSAMPQSLFS